MHRSWVRGRCSSRRLTPDVLTISLPPVRLARFTVPRYHFFLPLFCLLCNNSFLLCRVNDSYFRHVDFLSLFSVVMISYPSPDSPPFLLL